MKPSAVSSSASFFTASSFKSSAATFAPACAYARAISPHSTPPAPVTTTTSPVKSTFKGNFIIVFFLLTLIDMGEPEALPLDSAREFLP